MHHHHPDALYEAARDVYGGPRSFPLHQDATFARRYAYQPPNEAYERFFFACIRPSSQAGEDVSPRSAGWLIPEPEHAPDCKPVFVAHSTLSAIWLLRETLGDAALSDQGWHRLVHAARSCADGSGDAPTSTSSVLESPDGRSLPTREDDAGVPPSAQRPPKRATTAERTSSPKRTRVGGDRVPSPKPSNPGIPVVGWATTNNNRRAEQQRAKKLEALRAQKRVALGLQEPGPEASSQERAAYDAIPQKDETTIAWIIKQRVSKHGDFYSVCPTPYYTAASMLRQTRVLGNPSSQRCAAQFLQYWREQGTPFRTGTGEVGWLQHSQPRQGVASSDTDDSFRFAWAMCDRYETLLAAVHVGEPWSLALLGRAYEEQTRQIQEDDLAASNDRTRNRYGKGQVRSEARARLIGLVRPDPAKKDHDFFRNRIKRATRWYKIVQSLGWGSLLLIPHEEVTNRWLERVLRVGELDVFLELVRHERPELCEAGKALEAWLGPDGIAGAPISGKERLTIEAEAPVTAYEIEEVEDSDEEVDEVIEDLDSPALEGGSAAPAPLRQMTLLELFHPV